MGYLSYLARITDIYLIFMLMKMVKQERKRLKITQKQLCKRAGIGIDRYMRMELGGSYTDEDIARLLTELNLKILVVTSANFING